jgi:polyisoprenyl-phosphate glycosyltransferase
VAAPTDDSQARPAKVALGVVVPCYNEEEVLPLFLERMLRVLDQAKGHCELVMVDDGSNDRTWSLICEHAGRDDRIRGLRLSRNHGHQLALTAGLDISRGERTLIIDADLQDPPELLADMMTAMDRGADVVYGQRSSRKGVSWVKRACYSAYYRVLSYLAGTRIPPHTGDFRLISRRVLELLQRMPEQQRFLRGMVSWLGFAQVPVTYDRDGRAKGASKYTWRKLFQLAVDGIMSFSVAPLRFATLAASALALSALFAAGYVLLGTFFLRRPPEGWASLIVVVLLIGALQLLVLGIIGEYLGRIYLQSKARPLYMVADSTESAAER